IIARAQDQTDWHENTIKTLVSRLYKKEMVGRAKDGKQFFYSPVIEQSQIITEASDSLLSRFFEGKLSPLVAHFAQNKKLSDSDISEIESILKDMKKND
ncbi:MAG: BlaI/MecI/CopY family transcriptional regulator, partial [Marinicella sp.]